MRTKRESLSLLKSSGFTPEIIIDVGVAFGTDGLYENWPDLPIVLIEALSKFESNLQQLCVDYSKCEYILGLAGATAGELELATSPDHVHDHMLSKDAPIHWQRNKVPVVTVDDIVASRLSNDFPSVLLKVDVDGAELDVLAGSIKTLKGHCAVVIEAALCDEDASRFGRIMAFMLTQGYEVYDIIEPLFRPTDQFLWQVDLVFVPRDSPLRANRAYGSISG